MGRDKIIFQLDGERYRKSVVNEELLDEGLKLQRKEKEVSRAMG